MRRVILLIVCLYLASAQTPDHCYDIESTSTPDSCGSGSNLAYEGSPTSLCNISGCSSSSGRLLVNIAPFSTDYSILLWGIIKSTSNSDNYL